MSPQCEQHLQNSDFPGPPFSFFLFKKKNEIEKLVHSCASDRVHSNFGLRGVAWCALSQSNASCKQLGFPAVHFQPVWALTWSGTEDALTTSDWKYARVQLVVSPSWAEAPEAPRARGGKSNETRTASLDVLMESIKQFKKLAFQMESHDAFI